MSKISRSLTVLLLVAAAVEFTREAHAFGIGELGLGFGKLGVLGSGGNASGTPSANSLLSQAGVCILAQAGSCILVQ